MARILLTANTSWYLANFRTGLIRSLQALGHGVIVLAPPDEHVDRLETLGCQVVPLAMDNKGTSPIRDLQLFWRLREHIRQLKPDAVLSFTVKNNVYAGLACKSLGVPFLPTVNGLGTAFVKESWLTKIVSALSRAAFKSLPLVVFQNDDDRAMFIERRIVGSGQSVRVPGSGVDLKRFAHQSLPGDKHVVFLLIARLLWDKGVGEFVDAVRRLQEQGFPVQGKLLGFLDVENRAAIDRASVEAWQEEGVIEYLGTLTDVRPAIASADCVVLPSYYREGVPRSLLEAAAMGRPVVTTDAPGCRDVIDQGSSGLLCQPRSVDSLSGAMLEMIERGPGGRIVMSAAARTKMEREFDEEIVIETYTAWLSDALTQRAVG